MLLITRDLLIPRGFITSSIPGLLSDAAAGGTGAGRPEPYSTRSTANNNAVKRQPSVGHHL